MKVKQVFVDDNNQYHDTESQCLLADAKILLEERLEEYSAERTFYFEDFLSEIKKNKELRKALDLVLQDLDSKKPKGQP